MKKKFSINENVLFVTGVLMLIMAVSLWYLNGGFMRLKNAKAWADCSNPSNVGCYSEDWVATQVLGHPQDYYANLTLNATITECLTLNPFDIFYAVPGSPAKNCSGSKTGAIDGSPLVTQWTVSGSVEQ